MGYSLITYSKDCMATEGKKPNPTMPWKDKSGKTQDPHWTGTQETPYYRLKHAFFGFVTELGELRTPISEGFKDLTNMFEEIGDLWWYFGIYVDQVAAFRGAATGKSREDFFAEIDDSINALIEGLPAQYNPEDSAWAAFNLLEQVSTGIDVIKRTEYYRTKDINYSLLEGQLINLLGCLIDLTFTCIENSQWKSGADVDQREVLELVWRSNIAKLFKRFGDSFDAETAAAVRDVEAEREAITTVTD